MRLTRARLGFLIFALAVNLVSAGTLNMRSAYACSCAGTATPTEELKASDAVFSGEVVDLGVEDPNPQDDVPLAGVEFSVKESWKGVSERSVVIYGQGEGYGTSVINSCDIEFKRGRSYLVYAYNRGENGPLGTDICTATKPLAGAEADLRTLSPPTATLPDTGGSATLNNETTIVVITLLLFAMAGALVVRLRRGERP